MRRQVKGQTRLSVPDPSRLHLSAPSSEVDDASRTTPLPADIGKAEKDGASRNSMPVTADELRGAADRIVSNVHSTQTMPISSIKASNLDPDWSDLVWTALPADALKSFRSASERARTAGGNSKMDAVIWDAVPEACSGEDLFLARESGRGGGGTRICDSPFTVLGSGRDPRGVAEAAREKMGEDDRRCGGSDEVTQEEEEVKFQSGANDSKDHKGKTSAKQVLRPKVPAKMFNAVREACSEFNMVREGDKILVSKLPIPHTPYPIPHTPNHLCSAGERILCIWQQEF